MGRNRKQPTSREVGVCASCGENAPIVASNIFQGLCIICYKREYSRRELRLRGGRRRTDFWTDAEHEIVRAQYASVPQREMLFALPGRSWRSIKHKALELGVTRGRNAEYASIIADEPVRPNEYWAAWAAKRANAPTHPDIEYLIAGERQALRMLELRERRHG